jgi:diguanylate cyclase (GGDEF)-like protein
MKQRAETNEGGRIIRGVLLSLLVFFLIGTGISAKAADNRIVKVAFFPMTGYHEYDENGNPTGMDVDYLDALKEYTNWEIRYIDCDSWDEALDKLAKGEVDLVGSAQYSEEREKKFSYASFQSGYTFGAIMMDNDDVCAYEDFDTMSELTYGIVSTYVRKQEFLDYMSENGIDDPNIIEYSDSAALREGQANGEVDAIVHTYMEMGEGQQIIGRFAPSPFYYISGKDNTKLMEELNQGISELKMDNPLLESKLMKKYYGKKLNKSTVLTNEEKTYMESLGSLTVGYVDHYYPFSYEQDGIFGGMASEVFENLSTVVDTKIVYQKITSMELALSMLQNGKIDVLAYCIEDEEGLSDKGLKKATVYASAPLDELLGTDWWYEDAVDGITQECDVSAAVRNDADETLCSVLDKALGYIGDRDINEYIRKHPLSTKFSLDSWIREHQGIIACVALIVFLLIITVILRMLYDSKKMQKLLYKDGELDIWNLNYLLYTGESLLSDDQKKQYAVVYINVSQFRMYNTLYGWQEGNHLLQIMADQLKEIIDLDTEICSRDQGDRFILMLEWSFKEEFMDRLDRIEKMLENTLYQKAGIHMAVYLGVYFFKPNDTDIKSAIDFSNQAVAFLTDRNVSGIKVYDDQMDELVRQQHDKEELLDNANIDEDFIVYYQEKVDIRTQKIIGAEALVRFRDPCDYTKVLPPGYFISYYEKTGRVKEIDFFVLKSVCRMLRKRLDNGQPVVPISCNFSRWHFIENDFPERLEEVLEQYHISKELIEIEITETMVMEGMQKEIREVLEELKERNFILSIDDFGSGYSSLGVFERVPASVIKLDRSFLLNRTDRVRQVKIMQQIVSLADTLDTKVVCEGVETSQDVELMQEIGAYIAQGYYYAKPVPVEAFEERLEIAS